MVTATACAVLQVVAFYDGHFGLHEFRDRRLPRASVSRQSARHARRVFELCAIDVPFKCKVGQSTGFVLLSIKGNGDLVDVLREGLSLQFRSVGYLIVRGAAVVLGGHAVLTTCVGRRQKGPMAAQSAFAPRHQFNATNVAVAATAEVPHVSQTGAASRTVTAHARVVMGPIAVVGTAIMGAQRPIYQ